MDAKEAADRLVEIAVGAVAFEYMTDETALRMGAAALREVEQLRAERDRLRAKVGRAMALGERWHGGEWCSTPGDEVLDALHDPGDCCECGALQGEACEHVKGDDNAR